MEGADVSERVTGVEVFGAINSFDVAEGEVMSGT
jgi:hypothetical protein